MSKLATRYDYIAQQHDDGVHVRLMHLQNLREETFFIVKGQGNLVGICNHMDSLTDELCDSWLDDWRQDEAKKNAKAEAKLQRDRNVAQAAQERKDKAEKKAKNRQKQEEQRVQHAVLQSEQNTDNH